MSMNDTMGPSNEQTIAVLAQRAEQDGDDWRIRIARSESSNARGEVLATFNGATVEMIANAETWIPALFGGSGTIGVFWIYVMHVRDLAAGRTAATIRLPGMPGAPIPAARIPWEMIEQVGWPGPKILVYPKPADLGAASGTHGERLAKPSSSTGVPPPSSVPTDPASALMLLQAEQAKFADAQRKAEMDAIRRMAEEAQRRADSQLAEMRDLVKSVITTQRPQTDIVETVVKLGAVLTPLIAPLLDARRADATRAAEVEAKRIEREEAQRAEAQKRQDQLMEKVANQGTEVAKVMATMSEATATMTRTMLQTMTSAIEMGLGAKPQEEEGWGPIMKAFASAFGERMAVGFSTPPALPPAAAPRAAAPAQQPFAAPPSGPANNAPDEGNAVSVLEAIMGRIAERDPDVDGVADALITAIQTDAETQEALRNATGNFVLLMQSMFGNEWAQDAENSKYANTLLAALGPKAQAAGMLAPQATA